MYDALIIPTQTQPCASCRPAAVQTLGLRGREPRLLEPGQPLPSAALATLVGDSIE